VVSGTYSDVDASAESAAAITWQERMATWPGIDAYKRRTHQLIAGAEVVLDVGCGPGDDVLALGDRCVGVDRAGGMCARAGARGAVVARADADLLPFPDATFAAARSDRTFQHLVDPEVALREVLRVLRPGGVVVLVDPDQESLVIQVPGVRQSVLDRLKRLRRDVGYRNGRWASAAPAALAGLGAEVTSVEAFSLVLTDPADAFGLPTWPDLWAEAGGFTDEERAEWTSALRDRRPGFLYAVTFLVIAGRKR
jgi:SAM-dependent methyltransferase